MVDLQNVSPNTKFSHLKELVEPHIRRIIDCLPFTEEGYKRGLKYLEGKYSHTSEIAGSYVDKIIDLLSITEMFRKYIGFMNSCYLTSRV